MLSIMMRLSQNKLRTETLEALVRGEVAGTPGPLKTAAASKATVKDSKCAHVMRTDLASRVLEFKPASNQHAPKKRCKHQNITADRTGILVGVRGSGYRSSGGGVG